MLWQTFTLFFKKLVYRKQVPKWFTKLYLISYKKYLGTFKNVWSIAKGWKVAQRNLILLLFKVEIFEIPSDVSTAT